MVASNVCLVLVWPLAPVVPGWGWTGQPGSSSVHRRAETLRLRTTSAKHLTSSLSVARLRPDTMSSDNYDDRNDQGVITGAGEVLNLQMHTLRESPADTFASLSEACQRLGIDAFDVYGDFDSDEKQSYLRQFEAEVAHYFGKEDGVFCLSGGMAQSIVLAINARNHSPIHGGDNGADKTAAFACHPTSHLLLHENNAFSELLGMEAVVINPNSDSAKGRHLQYDPEALKENGCYGMDPVRLSHVQNLVSSLDDSSTSSSATTLTYPNLKPINLTEISTMILELPHREVGGKLTPWDEVEEISHLCKKHGIKYHCDGARIFEASAGYG